MTIVRHIAITLGGSLALLLLFTIALAFVHNDGSIGITGWP